MNYSNEQKLVFDEVQNGTENILISAVAGSGKTTTIVKSVDFLPNDKDILFLAFNQHVVETLKNRIKKQNVEITTLHSYGLKTLKMCFGNQEMEPNKVLKLCYEHSKKFVGVKNGKEKSYPLVISKAVDLLRLNNCTTVENVVNIFEENGLFFKENDVDNALKILKYTNASPKIDFLDMLYRPVKFNVRFKKYDYIFVDECQDLSIIQQEIIRRSFKEGTRIIAVGDPNQAIYSFAGADYKSFYRMKEFYKMKEMKLSTSYRCSKSVISFAQQVVSDIHYHEDSPLGSVHTHSSVDNVNVGDWIICRNTKPLVSMCIELFKREIPCYVKGKDYGNELKNMVMDTKTHNIERCKLELKNQLIELYSRMEKLGIEKPNRTNKYKELYEKVKILTDIIFEYVSDTNEALELIDMIFAESDSSKRVTLMTIHKSKGLENERVFFLGQELIPSKFARTESELLQENNLKYVAITRAKSELHFLDLPKEELEEEYDVI